MAELRHSQARRTLRVQVAFIWGSIQFLWVVFDVLLAVSLVNRAPAWEVTLASISLGAVAFVLWRLGLRSVDRLLGPMLDRLAEVAQASAALDDVAGVHMSRLVSDSPRAALGQLAVRLEDAQTGLRKQVDQLSVLNRELAETREELLRAERLAVLGRLAAGVGHEIGNPLGALIGFIGLLKGSPDPATSAEALAGIESQAQRIHRTLQELMDFARAGKMPLGPVPLPFAVETAAKLVRAHPRWREMRLTIDLVPELSQVRASEHHLVQVLVNLLLNASDACQGRGSVTVSGGAAEPGWVRLTVADDGPGIPPGEEDRIFEPFVSSKPVGQGTGLGLAISRQLIERFGGRIRAARGNPGARFDIDLHAEESR
jgi:two-component system NtrC family sensor kinase